MDRPAVRSLKGPITLFVIVLVFTVTLAVLWNFVLVADWQRIRELAATPEGAAFHWTFIAVGSALFVAIIALSCILGAQLIGQIRWSRRQSNFIASVSHELNSPLSSIKLFAQTIRRENVSVEDRRRFVDRILFGVERLSRLVQNILRAADLDRRDGDLLVMPEDVDLKPYIEEYEEEIRTVFRERGEAVRVALEPVAGPLVVALDRTMFRQVLDNIVDNAIRYRAGDETRITMRAARKGEWAEVEVADEGLGIPAREIPRIFERFYRIEDGDPARSHEGMGIGLYVVQSVVEAHGGKVGAHSEGPGRGATIWLRLPLIEGGKPA